MSLGEFIPTSNTKLLLHLNDNSNDSSGNSNNGTNTAVTFSQANGRFGQGAGFIGSNSSKITFVDSASLKPTGAFTIGFWIKTNNANNTDCIIFQSYAYNNRAYGISIIKNGSNKYTLFRIGNSTSTYYHTSSYQMNNNNWTCMGFTFDGTNTTKIYVDGNIKSTNTSMGAPSYNTTNYVRIGCENSSGTDINFWDFNLDEFIFENRAWTAQEMKKHYTNSLGRYATI